jgi:hypothetical protein
LRGARSRQCDWGFAFQESESTDSIAALRPALFLAYCLVQQGARRADGSDWQAAFAANFASLRFAADLKLGNLLDGLIAIDVLASEFRPRTTFLLIRFPYAKGPKQSGRGESPLSSGASREACPRRFDDRALRAHTSRRGPRNFRGGPDLFDAKPASAHSQA